MSKIPKKHLAACILVLTMGAPGYAKSSLQATVTQASSQADMQATRDCDALPLLEKEACYSGYDGAALAECEQIRLNACAPYARTHKAEEELDQASDALMQVAREAYASYEDTQQGYVKDLEDAYAEANTAWRAYRDTHCALEPILQGMSRSEAPDLTEACRARMTEARVDEMKEQATTLFMEGEPN